MSEGRRMIPVWFFVGMILLIYGVIILATGIYELSNPAPPYSPTCIPPLWWGAVLTVLGGLYVYMYMPKNRSAFLGGYFRSGQERVIYGWLC